VWGVAEWATTNFEEVQSWAPTTRPRGLSAVVTLTHTDNTRIDLLDFDLRYEDITRGVRALDMGGTPPAGA
jgi:hypothetical protein